VLEDLGGELSVGQGAGDLEHPDHLRRSGAMPAPSLESVPPIGITVVGVTSISCQPSSPTAWN
jgi:hypothetical protein